MISTSGSTTEARRAQRGKGRCKGPVWFGAFWLRLCRAGYFVVPTFAAELIRTALWRREIPPLDFCIQPMQAGFDPALHLAHVFGEGPPVRIITGSVAPAACVSTRGLSQGMGIRVNHAPGGRGREISFPQFVPAPG